MFCFMYGGVVCSTPQPSHADHPHLTIITNHIHLYIFPSHSTTRRQIVSYTYLVKLSFDLSSPLEVILILVSVPDPAVFLLSLHLSRPSFKPTLLPGYQFLRTIEGLFGNRSIKSKRTPDHHEHSPRCGNKLFNCHPPRPAVVCAVHLGSPRLEP